MHAHGSVFITDQRHRLSLILRLADGDSTRWPVPAPLRNPGRAEIQGRMSQGERHNLSDPGVHHFHTKPAVADRENMHSAKIILSTEYFVFTPQSRRLSARRRDTRRLAKSSEDYAGWRLRRGAGVARASQRRRRSRLRARSRAKTTTTTIRRMRPSSAFDAQRSRSGSRYPRPP